MKCGTQLLLKVAFLQKIKLALASVSFKADYVAAPSKTTTS